MSMRNYCCMDRGLILASDELEAFIKKYCESDPEVDAEYCIDAPYEFAEYFGASFICGDDADDICLEMLDGGDNTGYSYMDNYLVLPSSLPIYTFANLLTKGITVDMLIEDIKNKYGKYLPEDFNYPRYIGQISYITFG